MRLEELEVVCQEAARNLYERSGGALQASVVLPLPARTSVTTLPDWPDDDDARTLLLERFASDVAGPNNASCYGFVAEGIAATDGDHPVEVVVVAFGARNNHPRIAAAVLSAEGLGEFTESEALAPSAMPFLAPLQRVVDAARPPDAFSG